MNGIEGNGRAGLEIERVPWESLKPHPENPRNGDVDAIAESVVVNGVFRPVITARDGTILAGHHLWYALGQLRHKEVDIVRLDLDPYSHEAIRTMVSDNRTSDLGRYDDSLLMELLHQLEDTDDGLSGTGYAPDSLELLDALMDKDVAEPLDKPGYRSTFIFGSVDDAEKFFTDLGIERKPTINWPA